MERVRSTTEYKIAYASHEGMSGKRNEDSLGVFAWKLGDETNILLAVVADGVGGQIAGEVASRLTVDAFKSYFDGLEQINNVSGHLERAILSANKAVYEASQENPDYRGMSTTVVAVAIVDNRLYTAFVGDSRIYLMRDGRLRQISVDHTWAQEAIDAGLLTREQAKQHPNRNVIRRHLGGSPEVEVDHRLLLRSGQSEEEALANQGLALQPGDTLLLCSDGLTDMISDEAVDATLRAHYHNLEAASQELIDKANQAGGKDNITAVIVQVPGELPAAAAAPPAPVAKTAEPAPMAAAVPAAEKSKGGVSILLVAGGFVIVLLIAGVAALFIITSLGGSDPTPEPTSIPVVSTSEPEHTGTPGAPATAVILSPTVGVSPSATVEVVATSATAAGPTLAPTRTPTNTPRPTNTPTETPTVTPTPTATSAPSQPGPPPPQSTEPPPPPPPAP